MKSRAISQIPSIFAAEACLAYQSLAFLGKPGWWFAAENYVQPCTIPKFPNQMFTDSICMINIDWCMVEQEIWLQYPPSQMPISTLISTMFHGAPRSYFFDLMLYSSTGCKVQVKLGIDDLVELIPSTEQNSLSVCKSSSFHSMGWRVGFVLRTSTDQNANNCLLVWILKRSALIQSSLWYSVGAKTELLQSESALTPEVYFFVHT